jgi:hypothetical protein
LKNNFERLKMNTQHTPGPWTAHATGLSRSGLPEYQIHWSDIGECVAEVVHGTADAQLIAAAPDLLEALKDALCALECCGKDFPAATKASAAIAKATTN